MVSIYNLFINYSSYYFHLYSRYTGPKFLIFLPYLLLFSGFIALTNLESKDDRAEWYSKFYNPVFLILYSILLYHTFKILYIYSDEGYDKRLDNFIGGNYFVLERSLNERLLKIQDDRAYGLIGSGYVSNQDIPNPHEIFPVIFLCKNRDEYSKDLFSTVPPYRMVNSSEREEKLYGPYMKAINSSIESILGFSFEYSTRIIFDYAFRTGPNLDPDTLLIRLPSIREIHLREIFNMMVADHIRRKLRIEDENLTRKLYSHLDKCNLHDLMRVEYQCDLIVELYGIGSGITLRNQLFSSQINPHLSLTEDTFLHNGFSYDIWNSSLREFGKNYPSLKGTLRGIIAREILNTLDSEIVLIKSLLDRIHGSQKDRHQDNNGKEFFEGDVKNTFREFANENNLIFLTSIREKFLYAKYAELPLRYSFYTYHTLYNSNDFLFNCLKIPAREGNPIRLSLKGFNMTIEFYNGGYSQINARAIAINDDNERMEIISEGKVNLNNVTFRRLPSGESFNPTNLNVLVPSRRFYSLIFTKNLQLNIDKYLEMNYPSLSCSTPIDNYLECVTNIIKLPQYEWVNFILNNMDYDLIVPLIGRLPRDLGAFHEAYRYYFLHYNINRDLPNSISSKEMKVTTALVIYWVKHTMFRYGNEVVLRPMHRIRKRDVINYMNFYESGFQDFQMRDERSLRGKYAREQDERLMGDVRKFIKIFLAISLRQALGRDIMQLIPYCRWASLRIDIESISICRRFYEPFRNISNIRKEKDMIRYDQSHVSSVESYQQSMTQYGKERDIRIHLLRLIESQNNLLSETSILSYLNNKHGKLIIDETQYRLNNLNRNSKPNPLPGIEDEIKEALETFRKCNKDNTYTPDELNTNPLRDWKLNNPNRNALYGLINDSNSDESIVYDAESDFQYPYEYE